MKKSIIQETLAILVLGFPLTYVISSAHLNTQTSIAPYSHLIFNQSDDLMKPIVYYENQLRTNPNGPLLLSTLASLYAKEAKLSGDMTLFDKAETLAKKSRSILQVFNEGPRVVLADIAQAKHDFRKAVELCKEILADPHTRGGGRQASLSLLVTSYLALGDLNEAGRYADQLIDLRPSVGAHALRALVMSAQGRIVDASLDFQTAFSLEEFGNPVESAWLRAMWGRLEMKQGHFDTAQSLFKEALKISPSDPLSLNLLADLEVRQGKYTEAEAHYVEAFSNSKQIVHLIGQIKVKKLKGDLSGSQELRDQVEKLLRKQLARSESGYAHRTELVRVLLDRGAPSDIQEAVSLLREEIKLRQSSETYYYLSLSLFHDRKYLEAREAIREALRPGVQDAEYFHLAGMIEENLGNLSQAGFYSERAQALDPSLKSKRQPKLAVLESNG